MPSTLEKLSPTRVKLTIDMPFADLEPAIEKAYQEIANQVNIPGFRKGKVPPRLIDQRFGRGVVLQEAINEVLPYSYGQAVQENDLRPLGQPEIDVTELNDGENVVFTAEVDVRPEFEVVDASEISVEVPTATVSDEDVNERVELLRERFATQNEVDRAAADGDVVNLNLTARQDGTVLDDAEAKDVQYKLGAGGMVEGLDEAITGLKAGESKTFTSTLVGGPHRGEEAEIEVEVLKVSEQELPKVDAEFAQLVSEFDTSDEMLADIRDNLERLARIDQANKARESVIKQIVEKSPFELPEGLIESEKEARHNAINEQLKNAGLTVEQYLADTEETKSVDEFWAEIDESIELDLRAQIILDKVGEEGEFEVGQQDLTELIFSKAQQAGTTPEQELQHMMEHNHSGEWMAEIRRGKALGKLVDDATVTDEDGNTVDLSRLNNDGTIAESSDEAKEPAKKSAKKPAAKKADEKSDEKPAKKTAKKPAAKKPAAKKADEKSDEKPAKKTAKKPAAKKPAAKKPAAKKADEKPESEAKKDGN